MAKMINNSEYTPIFANKIEINKKIQKIYELIDNIKNIIDISLKVEIIKKSNSYNIVMKNFDKIVKYQDILTSNELRAYEFKKKYNSLTKNELNLFEELQDLNMNKLYASNKKDSMYQVDLIDAVKSKYISLNNKYFINYFILDVDEEDVNLADDFAIGYNYKVINPTNQKHHLILKLKNPIMKYDRNNNKTKQYQYYLNIRKAYHKMYKEFDSNFQENLSKNPANDFFRLQFGREEAFTLKEIKNAIQDLDEKIYFDVETNEDKKIRKIEELAKENIYVGNRNNTLFNVGRKIGYEIELKNREEIDMKIDLYDYIFEKLQVINNKTEPLNEKEVMTITKSITEYCNAQTTIKLKKLMGKYKTPVMNLKVGDKENKIKRANYASQKKKEASELKIRTALKILIKRANNNKMLIKKIRLKDIMEETKLSEITLKRHSNLIKKIKLEKLRDTYTSTP